jgi:uncharacterized membrane protein YphA (DoxX/SURF4 family)
MKKTKILYWVFTGLLSALMLLSGIPDIFCIPDAVEMVTTKLGYPIYFIPFLGVAKVLGAIVLLIPGFSRIKEWAYAGFVFDLVAAGYSFICIGEPLSAIPLVIGFALITCSYIFHHKKLVLEKSAN